jgi:hypothetical protein
MRTPSVFDVGGFGALLDLPGLPVALLSLILVGFLGSGCGPAAPPPEVPSPPTSILLITTTGLRADSIGPLTPALEAFREECRREGWAGTGLAVSSETAPAIASLLTGLRPWQTQVLHSGQIRLPDALTTLAEALGDLGYHTAAFLPNYRLRFGHGYAQGFDEYLALGNDGPAEYLENLPDSPTFVWIHLPEPQPPYRQHPQGRPRLEAFEPLPDRLPREMDWADLATAGAVDLPEARRLRARALYHYEVAGLDDTVGRLLEALRAAGRWQRSIVVFTSLHGTELGEHGFLGSGDSLHREVLEVPLMVKESGPRTASRIAPHSPDTKPYRPAIGGLWATLVKAAGGTPPPTVEPDVLSPAAARPVLSALYRGNGRNLFSLVDGDLQLLRTVPFAAEEKAYRSARLAQRGVPRERLKPPVEERPLEPLSRLRRAFDDTLPFSSPQATAGLLRWSSRGSGVEIVHDPVSRDRLAHHLDQRWHAFVILERTPAQEVEMIGRVPRRGPR